MSEVGSTINYGTVAVDATAELVLAGNSRRKSVVLENVHASQDLYVGDDSSVTTANGIKVTPGSSLSFDDYNGPLWGIGSGAATDTRYMEVV